MVVLSAKGRDALDQLVAKTIKDANLSGFVFGATTAEGELYVNGGGDRIFNDPSGGQVTPDSVFWICSQTKLITHLAALQLIERGLIHVDDPVSDYVPELTNLIVLDDITKENPSYAPAKEIVRVKHLLNSTAGLFYPLKGAGYNGWLVLPYSSPHNEEDPIGEFCRLLKYNHPGIPLKSEPGTDFAYGFSSDILGFVIERATKKTLEEYFKQNIFDPLGIKISFHLTDDLKEKRVAFVVQKGDGVEALDPNVKLFETDPAKVHLRFGGCGLYSSARDYLTLLRHLLQIRAGTASKPVFSKEIIASIFTPTLDDVGQKSIQSLSFFDPFSPWNEGMQWSTALGVNLKDWPGRRKKGSGNWLGWANTFHFIDPTTGVAAVFKTQVLPPLNPGVMEYAAKFETALYAALE